MLGTWGENGRNLVALRVPVSQFSLRLCRFGQIPHTPACDSVASVKILTFLACDSVDFDLTPQISVWTCDSVFRRCRRSHSIVRFDAVDPLGPVNSNSTPDAVDFDLIPDSVDFDLIPGSVDFDLIPDSVVCRPV